jgi:hypothetical protein
MTLKALELIRLPSLVVLNKARYSSDKLLFFIAFRSQSAINIVESLFL